MKKLTLEHGNFLKKSSPRPASGRSSRKSSLERKSNTSRSHSKTTCSSSNTNSLEPLTSGVSKIKLEPRDDELTLSMCRSISSIDPHEDFKAELEYRSEPYFELSGEYHFGYAEKFRGAHTDNSKNFKPQYKRLVKEGGKSIQLYEEWRIMQYKLNIVIKRFLVNHGINSSVLPPCDTYDMWRNVEWRELYRDVLDKNLDEDPCPDCDVRFFKDKNISNKYTFKLAPSSILEESRWSKRRYLNTVLLVGLPQHITIACCREHADHVMFEFFDPAGPKGDLQSVKAVKQWAETFLWRRYSNKNSKNIIFSNITKNICFQADSTDVMCQTWIWYWVYWRMVRQENANTIIKHVKSLCEQNKSLQHIQLFNKWMIELYKLGYLIKENASEAKSASKASPPSFKRLAEHKKKKILKMLEEKKAEYAKLDHELKSYESDDFGELDDCDFIKITTRAKLKSQSQNKS